MDLKKSNSTVSLNNIKLEFTHIHHVSSTFLEDFYQTYAPVFILNTGRSGSALLQEVFGGFEDIKSYHEAPPNLFLQCNYAYHNQYKEEVLLKMFEASRVELMLQAKVENKIFLETNQCLVFYVHQIVDLFPNAKFVHLTRHPGDFVRSGILKGWQKNDSVWESGRIKMKNKTKWASLSQIEKLSWVWKNTHGFIENFKAKHGQNCYTIRLESIVENRSEFNDLIEFIGSKRKVGRGDFKRFFEKKQNQVHISENEPQNMYKLSDYTKYEQWSKEDKNALAKYAGELCLIYNYDIV